MSKQRRFSDVKEGELFVILEDNEPARVLMLTHGGDGVYRMDGVRRGTMAVFSGSIKVSPETPVKLIDKQSFIGSE